MTKEEKDLLLKDLCARLPYKIKVFVSGEDFDNYQHPYLLTAISKFGQESLCKVYSPFYTPFGSPNIEYIKPYLRPMSSMTDEEEEKYNRLNVYELGLFPHTEEAFDWLNAHHFDYRGLIEKGLAIEVTENNNPYERK